MQNAPTKKNFISGDNIKQKKKQEESDAHVQIPNAILANCTFLLQSGVSCAKI